MRNLWPRGKPLPDHYGSVISDFQPPELWEINFSGLWGTQSVVSCYISLTGLRRLPWQQCLIYQGLGSQVLSHIVTPASLTRKGATELTRHHFSHHRRSLGSRPQLWHWTRVFGWMRKRTCPRAKFRYLDTLQHRFAMTLAEATWASSRLFHIC